MNFLNHPTPTQSDTHPSPLNKNTKKVLNQKIKSKTNKINMLMRNSKRRRKISLWNRKFSLNMQVKLLMKLLIKQIKIFQ